MLHLILLNMIILIVFREEYKFWSSSSCNSLYPLATYSSVRPNIPLCTLFLDLLSLCSALRGRGQVSHPYETGDKTKSYVCFNICDFRYHMGRRTILNWNVIKNSLNLICSLFIHECDSDLLVLFPNNRTAWRHLPRQSDCNVTIVSAIKTPICLTTCLNSIKSDQQEARGLVSKRDSTSGRRLRL
jgi:hypothetical protein